MPYSFLRRWSYDELIPPLLYFDRVTFVMDDISPHYLFTAGLENAIDLDQQVVPEGLRQMFSSQQALLSRSASVTVVTPGTLWKIRDGKRRYQIEKSISEKLVIYGSPEMGLVNPKKLQGRDGNEPEGGLSVDQHRYYWPMRDLIGEEVILVTGMDMSRPHFIVNSEIVEALLQDERNAPFVAERFIEREGRYWLREGHETAEIEALLHIEGAAPLARQYVLSASRYYDAVAGDSAAISPEAKAMEVRNWIGDALVRRRGWAQVALNPHGLAALLAAETLFGDLRRLGCDDEDRERETKWYGGHLTPPSPTSSYVAMRVAGNLLQKELHSFALRDPRDPEALSEILRVREKYRSECEAFRTAMLDASRNMQWETPRELIQRADDYVRQVEPAYSELTRAMADRWRTPKLVFRKGGVLVTTGVVAGLGFLIAGHIGAAVGGTVGNSLGEGVRAIMERLGDDATAPKETIPMPTNKAMAYLFHTRQALERSTRWSAPRSWMSKLYFRARQVLERFTGIAQKHRQ
jgi:hypothetical protein